MDVGGKKQELEDQKFVDNILSLKSKCVLAKPESQASFKDTREEAEDNFRLIAAEQLPSNNNRQLPFQKIKLLLRQDKDVYRLFINVRFMVRDEQSGNVKVGYS